MPALWPRNPLLRERSAFLLERRKTLKAPGGGKERGSPTVGKGITGPEYMRNSLYYLNCKSGLSNMRWTLIPWPPPMGVLGWALTLSLSVKWCRECQGKGKRCHGVLCSVCSFRFQSVHYYPLPRVITEGLWFLCSLPYRLHCSIGVLYRGVVGYWWRLSHCSLTAANSANLLS